MPIALDSSVLVGLLNPADVWHARASALHDAILKSNVDVIYFDCAIAEAISAVARRLHEKGRGGETADLLQRLEAQMPRAAITWILPDVPRLYAETFELIRFSSGELNFNDALIALACRERSISMLASFDPDFDRLTWLKRVTAPTDVT